MTVRTRFAPSPTGYLHIGGVRTALFNWLFARKHGGQFILRIDDTDEQRNVKEALQPILDGFRWLGIDWDEGAEVGGPCGPYYQSQKLARYQEVVRQLLDKGLAYWDYAKPDEMKAEMETAEKEKRPKIYSRRWMATTDTDRKRFEAEGRAGSIRLKMPREGTCQFFDHIRGDVEVQWSGEQDIVIQRGDEKGTVTYNLANVVDDYDMKISHVIRAEEHLSNTPRQLFIIDGLGLPRPEYAHVPFVAEPGSKNKLSKRKIAQYLKNSDFKKVYEHGVISDFPVIGLEIASKVRDLIIRHRRGSAPNTVKPVSRDFIRNSHAGQALLKFMSRYNLGLSYTVNGDEWQEVVAERLLSVVQDYWDNPEFLDIYTHGKKVLNKVGASSRLSETFNPVVIDFYREVGYQPDAILNYLVLLGWSLDSTTEDFTRQQMIDLFSLVRVNKAPASFDAKKLFAFQERYMTALPVETKVELTLPFLQKAGIDADRGIVTKIVEAAGPRIKVAGDIFDYLDFFTPDAELHYDEKALAKHVRSAPGSEWIAGLREIVATAEPFDATTLKAKVEAFTQAHGAKPIPVSQTLRVAVTGKEVGFGTFDTLAILGRERSLTRIDRALNLS